MKITAQSPLSALETTKSSSAIIFYKVIKLLFWIECRESKVKVLLMWYLLKYWLILLVVSALIASVSMIALSSLFIMISESV